MTIVQNITCPDSETIFFALVERFDEITRELDLIGDNDDDPRKPGLWREYNQLLVEITTSKISSHKAKLAKAKIVKLHALDSGNHLLSLILQSDDERIAAAA